MKKFGLLTGAAVLLAAASVRGGDAFKGFEKPEDLPGAVSLVWTGEELLADVSGYADLATKRPASTNDLFWVASNTKAIACSLMLLQIDKGLVKLDAPVADYLPEWKDIRLKDGRAPSHAPTVRELMGHNAGLAFFPKMPITQFSMQELAHMAVTNGLDHDVGQHLYSNWGIDVAMAVVESVTGRPWEQSLQEEVLDPLGMKDTTFFPTDEDCEKRVAKSYRFDPYDQTLPPQEIKVEQLVYPYGRPGTHAEAGGGLFSTASDIMSFYRMIANRGRLPDGRQFISEEMMNELYGLTEYYQDKKYTFGITCNVEKGTVGHGGAYNTNGSANWKRGTARVFMTQISMWTARSVARRRNWEDYAAQWLDINADRVWRNNITWFEGASPSATADVNTRALNQAFAECRTTGGAGEVTIPKGVFTIGAYTLPDNVTLKFEEGAKFVTPEDSVCFAAAEPIWPKVATNEINTSVAFTTSFDWDGASPLKLRLSGCSIFKVFVNGEFAAYGPARGPHGWFRMDEWDISRFARKGCNRLAIEGVAYNTTTYYIVEHAPFLQAEVLADGKVVRATGDGEWDANFTDRVRKTPRYSLQRAQSEVYEVPRQDCREWWKRDGLKGKSLIVERRPVVPLLKRGAPYPTFEMDRSYRPTDVLSVRLRKGDLGAAPNLWGEKTSFLGKTYPDGEVQCNPAVDWWKRDVKVEKRGGGGEERKGGERRIDSSCGVRYEGAIDDTGFLRLKVKVSEPGRIVVGFDEILVDGRLDFLNRVGCNNLVQWNVKEPGEYQFETFEPYTFKYADVIMLEGAAEVESLELRTYKNPDATKACPFDDPADRKIFEAARETFAQNAVDVFTDCPSRERAGWLCDSYFTGPAECFFTGSNEIERTFLRNFALADAFPHLPEGMVPMCYPGDHVNANYIPNWSMWLILELANYFERTGDRETVELLKPRVEGLLGFYAQYLNADGVLENLPGWVFVEWSHANDQKLVKDGVNWPSNMTYADVLAAVAKLYARPELAERSAKLKTLIRERAFDGMWFRDNAKHPDVTETCQYYAFFHGIATPKTHPALWKKLTDEFGPERTAKGLYPEVWPSNAFIGNLMRLIILKREGLDAQVAREVRGYYLKMAESTGTLWEHDRPEASCNHGFAAYLAILLSK